MSKVKLSLAFTVLVATSMSAFGQTPANVTGGKGTGAPTQAAPMSGAMQGGSDSMPGASTGSPNGIHKAAMKSTHHKKMSNAAMNRDEVEKTRQLNIQQSQVAMNNMSNMNHGGPNGMNGGMQGMSNGARNRSGMNNRGGQAGMPDVETDNHTATQQPPGQLPARQ